MKSQNHIYGSADQTAAKLILVLLLSFVATTLVAQETPTPLLERLNGTTWKWSPTNVGGTTTTTVTFKGATLEYSWGGNGTLTSTSDPLTIALKTTDGIVLDMVFDPFTSGFEVKNGPRIIARGRKPAGTTAVPATATTEPGQSDKQIKLKTGWDTPMQGGSKTLADLALVLRGFGVANNNPPAMDIEIYNGVKYLMPVNEAVAALGLNQRLPAAKKVVCPGLPKDCFNYISFDGMFDGHFNRLDLVVDSANQVVSVQLVDEHPKDTSAYFDQEGDLTYNFIGYRVKAMNFMKIRYGVQVYYKLGKRWESASGTFARELPNAKLIRVQTVLQGKDHRWLEQTRWDVPKPLADLIMFCIGKTR